MKRISMYWTAYLALLTALLVLIGFTPGISPALYPSLPQPQIMVETYWPQAGAEEIDREITQSLYAALSGVQGLQSCRSHSRRGRSSLHLSFTAACKTAAALRLVQSTVAQTAGRLPANAHSPRVRSRSRTDLPVFAAAVPEQSTAEAAQLRKQFSELPGITIGDSAGSSESTSVCLGYRQTPVRLGGVSTLETAARLRSRSYGASINGISLLPADKLQNLQLKRVLVRPRAPAVSQKSVHRLNGVRQHIITCYATDPGNRIRLCRRLLSLSAEFRSVKVIYNRGKELERILLSTALSVGCGIVTITLLLLIQLRSFNREALLLISSLPLILCTALGLAAVCNLSINIMSLAAVAVGSGLVVDAAVLFYEENCRIGAKAAAHAVRPPILMSNLTTLSIFIPVLLLPPSIRSNLREFMIVMTVILTAGTLWTLAVFPKLCQRSEARAYLHYSFHMRYCRNAALFRRLSGRQWLCLLLYTLVCTLPLPWIGQVDFCTFPRIGQRSLHMRMEFAADTQPDSIDARMQSYLLQVRDLPQVRSSSVSSHAGQASFTLTCTNGKYSTAVMNSLQKIPLPAGGSLIESGRGGSRKPFVLRMYAGHPEQLRQQLKKLAARIQAAQPAYQVYYHFKSPAPLYSLCFDANRCARLAVPPAGAARQVQRILSSAPAAKLGLGPQKDLLLQPSPYPGDFTDVYGSFCVLTSGRSRPLTMLSSLISKPGRGDLQRLNGALFSGLTVIPDSGRTLDAVRTVERILRASPLPAGCSIETAPFLRREREQLGWVSAAIALASILLPLLLFSYFSAWEPTLFVLSYIPPALALPLPFLSALDIPLSLPVLTGFLVNIGLSVNNALVLLSENPHSPLAAADLPRQLCLKLPSLTASTLTTASGVIPLLFAADGSDGVLDGLSIVIAVGAFSSWAMLFLSTAVLSHPLPCRIIKLSRLAKRAG